MKLNVLALGDIVGRPGRMLIHEKLRELRVKEHIHFVVANGENVAGGAGITPGEAQDLLNSGVDVITGGDHVWGKRDIIPFIGQTTRLLRPANYPPEQPGAGHTLVDTFAGKIGVLHVVGRIFMNTLQAECPFRTAEALAKQLRQQTQVVIVDMHCEATSEKIAMGWHLDGQVSFIFGTHTHIQTADERILPKGTAYITDAGMCGPYESVIGRRIDRVLHKFITQMPTPFDVAENDVRLCGAVATIDSETGRAESIRRLVLRQDGTLRNPGDSL
jgi:metallophosphoesterase (TIGR00282 family)